MARRRSKKVKPGQRGREETGGTGHGERSTERNRSEVQQKALLGQPWPAPASGLRRGPAPGRALARSDTAAPTGRPRGRPHKQPPTVWLLSSRPTLPSFPHAPRPILKPEPFVQAPPSQGPGPLQARSRTPIRLQLPRVSSRTGSRTPIRLCSPGPGGRTRTRAPELVLFPSSSAGPPLTSLVAAAALAGLLVRRSSSARWCSGVQRLFVVGGEHLAASGAPRFSKDVVISKPRVSNTISPEGLVCLSCSAGTGTAARSAGNCWGNSAEPGPGRHFVTQIYPSKPVLKKGEERNARVQLPRKRAGAVVSSPSFSGGSGPHAAQSHNCLETVARSVPASRMRAPASAPRAGACRGRLRALFTCGPP